MILDRKSIDPKYKWDLTAIYEDETAFYADYKKVEALVKSYPAHEKTITASAEGLYNALTAMCEIEDLFGTLWQYASLNFAVDTTNNAYQALNAKVRTLAIEAGAASWFVNPYILRLDEKTVEEWFESYPKLETYRRMIEKIMQR